MAQLTTVMSNGSTVSRANIYATPAHGVEAQYGQSTPVYYTVQLPPSGVVSIQGYTPTDLPNASPTAAPTAATTRPSLHPGAAFEVQPSWTPAPLVPQSWTSAPVVPLPSTSVRVVPPSSTPAPAVPASSTAGPAPVGDDVFHHQHAQDPTTSPSLHEHSKSTGSRTCLLDKQHSVRTIHCRNCALHWKLTSSL